MEERQYHVTYNFINHDSIINNACSTLPSLDSVVFVPCNPLGVFSEA